MNSHPITTMLAAAVPLRISDLANDPDLPTTMRQRAGDLSRLIAEKGDVLLYGSKKKGETAALFNETVDAIAMLAFAPGGIKVFGMHFCAPHPGIAPDNEWIGALPPPDTHCARPLRATPRVQLPEEPALARTIEAAMHGEPQITSPPAMLHPDAGNLEPLLHTPLPTVLPPLPFKPRPLFETEP